MIMGDDMNREINFAGLQSLFGDDYNICDTTVENGNFIFHINSHKSGDVCPVCGEVSTRIHSTYTRDIQDTPIRNRQTRLHVSAHKYDCLNTQCAVKVFVEFLTFAGRDQVRILSAGGSLCGTFAPTSKLVLFAATYKKCRCLNVHIAAHAAACWLEI
jgi:hypothetical protein